MALDRFKNESKVRRIGGKLETEYILFKKEIEYINGNFFEFFDLLQLTDDIDIFIKALNDGIHNFCTNFIVKAIRDIQACKIPKNKFLSPQMITKLEELPPEEREKKWERETKRNLKLLYKEIESEFLKKNGLFPLEPRHARRALELYGKSLFVSTERIEIDGAKFIEVYESHIIADESETNKLHEQAAEAINRFFNGVKITQEELSKYFILEDGKIMVRPKSVNIDDYSRLGRRNEQL